MAAITATPVVLSARARVAPSGSAVRAAAVVRPKLSKRSVTVFAKKGECADLFFRPPAVANKQGGFEMRPRDRPRVPDAISIV